MFKWLKKLFTKNELASVDSIMAPLKKKQTELEDNKFMREVRKDANLAKIKVIEAENEAHDAELRLATNIIAQLDSIMNPKGS